MEECKEPKACTILLRGGSKDFLNEVERNLQDAMQVARNVVFEPKLLPGGGATEMAISVGGFSRACAEWCYLATRCLAGRFSRPLRPSARVRTRGGSRGPPTALTQRAKTIEGVEQWPFRAVGAALEVIPRTLAQNCGADTVRLLTELRVRCLAAMCATACARHLNQMCCSYDPCTYACMFGRFSLLVRWLMRRQAAKAGGANPMMGIDGIKGVLADMSTLGVWDTFAVKVQTLKTAIEVRRRVDWLRSLPPPPLMAVCSCVCVFFTACHVCCGVLLCRSLRRSSCALMTC